MSIASVYAVSPVSVESRTSVLFGDRVFCGEHWDDFALAALCLDKPGRALLLGLGSGAGIRPLIATGMVSSVDAVDVSPTVVDGAMGLYRRRFPAVDLTAHVADACQFLADTNETWEIICVDVYQDDAYVEFMLDAEFWALVASRLSMGGAVMANAFGLPWHLEPLQPATPQCALVTRAAGQFPVAAAVPSRRNITLLLSRDPLSADRSDATPDRLTANDSLGLAIQRARLSHPLATRPDLVDLTVSDSPILSLDAIDRVLIQSWDGFLATLRRVAPNPMLAGLRPPLPAVVRDAEYAYQATCKLLAASELAAASFFPTFAAVETFFDRDGLDRFWARMSDGAEGLIDLSPTFVTQFLLPQMFAAEARQPSPRPRRLQRCVDLLRAVTPMAATGRA